MLVDAVILTGGRSSRLDFTTKSEFVVERQTLLDRTVTAARNTRQIVIVGPKPTDGVPGDVSYAREDPPYDGPVSGIAAGMAALAAGTLTGSDATLVLACDMPHIALAVPLLLDGLRNNPDSDGAIGIDADGRLQPLAAVYRTASLTSAIAAHRSTGSLTAMPMFRLIDGLNLIPIIVPEGATADVDSWDDAERLGARPPMVSAVNEGEPHE